MAGAKLKNDYWILVRQPLRFPHSQMKGKQPAIVETLNIQFNKRAKIAKRNGSDRRVVRFKAQEIRRVKLLPILYVTLLHDICLSIKWHILLSNKTIWTKWDWNSRKVSFWKIPSAYFHLVYRSQTFCGSHQVEITRLLQSNFFKKLLLFECPYAGRTTRR